MCANTQAAAIRDHVSSFAVRHTRNAKAAIQQARDALGLTFAYHAAFEAEAERLIQTTMTDATFDQLIDAVVRRHRPGCDATHQDCGAAAAGPAASPVR